MSSINFKAPEYQSDGSFEDVDYEFVGAETEGWKIIRNGVPVMELGPGYVPVHSVHCGVCSTDLARRFLPYPLPQLIGHEVVARRHDTDNEKAMVVEINASHLARGLEHEAATCPFCSGGMNTQCPERITLGIDRLPGGFSPWFLAPVDAIREIPEKVSTAAASLTEPFAAALQGVEATHPRAGQKVAVLGPRRLGALLLSALKGFRIREKINFEIHALARHDQLLKLSQEMGADVLVDTRKTKPAELAETYDIIFDTTGKPEGFADALSMTRGVLHLKSTNGQEVMGLKHLTDMVVDEIALIPFTPKNLSYGWPLERSGRRNKNVYVAPGVPEEILATARRSDSKDSDESGEHVFHRLPVDRARENILGQKPGPDVNTGSAYPEGSPFPRFDLAIASSLAEVDQIMRPVPGEEVSLVRPRGAILLCPSAPETEYESELARAVLSRGIQIHTSRCGDFNRALKILGDNPDIAQAMENSLISHRYNLDDITTAFDVAADSSRSVKVLVDTGTYKNTGK